MLTNFLDVPDGRIAYDAAGEGPLVLAIPGMGDLRSQYRMLAPRLAEAGFRVVTMDVRGHGETSTGWPDHSLAGVGADALALIAALDAGPAIIIGNSFAAGSAVWAAAEAPDAVAGLVLIGPFVRDVPTSRWQALMFRVSMSGPWKRAAWTWYWSSLFPSQQPPDFDEHRDLLAKNLSEPGRFEALRAMAFASKTASAERLDKVRAPTLVVMGTRDPDFSDPEGEGRYVAEQLHGELLLVDGAGHYPHVEVPDATVDPVIAFVRQTATARA